MKHKDVRKVDGMSSLNIFCKHEKALGMDYVDSIKAKYLLVKMEYLSKLVELDVSE